MTVPCLKKQERLKEDEVQAFLERFVIELNGCWEWCAYTSKKGYGTFSFASRAAKAHRVSWVYFNGRDVPAGKQIMHACDNRKCVNPAHLSPGTNKQNADDRDAKGRYCPLPGTRNGRALLTDEQVKQIRESKLSLRETGMKFGVSKRTVLHIKQGTTWKHVG